MRARKSACSIAVSPPPTTAACLSLQSQVNMLIILKILIIYTYEQASEAAISKPGRKLATTCSWFVILFFAFCLPIEVAVAGGAGVHAAAEKLPLPRHAQPLVSACRQNQRRRCTPHEKRIHSTKPWGKSSIPSTNQSILAQDYPVASKSKLELNGPTQVMGTRRALQVTRKGRQPMSTFLTSHSLKVAPYFSACAVSLKISSMASTPSSNPGSGTTGTQESKNMHGP